MASNPTTAPPVRPCAAARLDRARRWAGDVPADRVAGDMSDRLLAVTRNFADVAEIWTPGEVAKAAG
jgi:hypothetical protein